MLHQIDLMPAFGQRDRCQLAIHLVVVRHEHPQPPPALGNGVARDQILEGRGHDRANGAEQFLFGNRLGEIRLSAHFAAPLTVAALAPSGEDHDARVRKVGIVADPTRHLEPVLPIEPRVENGEVHRLAGNPGPVQLTVPLFQTRGSPYRDAGIAQCLTNELAAGRIAVHHQHAESVQGNGGR